MQNATTALLDAYGEYLARDGGSSSDYRIAKEFGVSKQRVSQWRRGVSGIGGARSVELCELMWPGDEKKKIEWLARLAADREPNVQVKSVWEAIAKQVAVVALAVGLGSMPPIPW